MRSILMLLIFLSLSIAQEKANDTASCQSFYEQGQYDKAVECFSNKSILLEPQGDKTSLLQVYSSLGASYVMADKPLMAKAVFGKMLLLSPYYELDPGRFPPDIITIYQIARKEYLPQSYPLRYSFAPFGIPQYKNREKKKAIILAAIQTAALTISIIGYNEYTSRKSDQFVIAEEYVDGARTAARMHTIGFVTFSLSYVYGIIDGLIHKPMERSDVETHHNTN